MSNKPPKLSPPTVGANAFVVYEYEISDLEGRLLTLVESLGLPEKQESAVKGLLRQSVWQMPNHYRYVSSFEIIEKVIAENEARNELNQPTKAAN